MSDRYAAIAEGRVACRIIDAPLELRRFLDARARGASRAELLRLRVAAQISPARAERIKHLSQEDK